MKPLIPIILLTMVVANKSYAQEQAITQHKLADPVKEISKPLSANEVDDDQVDARYDRVFDDLSDRFWHQSFSFGFPRLHFTHEKYDVEESDQNYQLTIEVPGFNEKDISIDIDNHVLSITAQKKMEDNHVSKTYQRIKKSNRSFYRSIPLPNTIDEANIQAVVKNGLLTITLPKNKSQGQQARKILIKSE